MQSVVLLILLAVIWVKYGSGRSVLKGKRRPPPKRMPLLKAQDRYQNDARAYYQVSDTYNQKYPLSRDPAMDHTFTFLEQ